MPAMIFLNLPVNDVEVSKTFFEKLGYASNPQFSDERTACVVVSDTIFVMLLEKDRFKDFTKKDIADAETSAEALICLSAESRAGVDELVDAALAAGGSPALDPQDHGFMYQRSFLDPDHHQWEIMWMDPAAVAGQG